MKQLYAFLTDIARFVTASGRRLPLLLSLLLSLLLAGLLSGCRLPEPERATRRVRFPRMSAMPGAHPSRSLGPDGSGLPMLSCVFNVPELLFATGAQVEHRLGRPNRRERLSREQWKRDDSGELEYVRDTLTLLVRYASRTGQVRSLHLGFAHAVRYPMQLRQVGGIPAGGIRRYVLRLVPVAGDSARFAGLDIIPLN